MIKRPASGIVVVICVLFLFVQTALAESGFERSGAAAQSAAAESGEVLTHSGAVLLNASAQLFGAAFARDGRRYIEGFPDGSFRPDDGVTRAEAAMMLYRLLVVGGDDGDGDGNKSSDDGADGDGNGGGHGDGDAYGKDALSVTANSGGQGGEWYWRLASDRVFSRLMTVGQNDVIRPEAPMKRVEFAEMLAAIDGLAFNSTPMRFADVTDDYQGISYIRIVASCGWMLGYDDGTFRPDGLLTRAEAVTVLNRLLGRGATRRDLSSDAPRFTDLDESHWAFYEIMEASAPDREPASDSDGNGAGAGGAAGGDADTVGGGAEAAGDDAEMTGGDVETPGDGADSPPGESEWTPLAAREYGLYVPGEMIVGMKEKTRASRFQRMFADLEIDYIVDLYEKAKLDMGDEPVSLSNKTIFRIRLADPANDYVLAAIDIVSKHPSVEYAELNGPAYWTDQIAIVFMEDADFVPGVVEVLMKTITELDEFLEMFSHMPIEGATDSDLRFNNMYRRLGRTLFFVDLETKTKPSVFEAIEMFLAHPSVETAMPSWYATMHAETQR